jgi:hypothetical protein
MQNNRKLSVISAMHYFKLVYRSLLFIGAFIFWLTEKIKGIEKPFEDVEHKPVILLIIWIIFTVEMLLRFFPSKTESMGCQKQFSKNYKQASTDAPDQMPWVSTLAVASAWIALNALIGIPYLLGLFDSGVLLLVSLAFAVCDMICILFFCPFQTWFMKNKCCTTCRIYNWDYAMMFTPLIFIPNLFTWSLLGISLLLLIEWEILYKRFPERFVENCNSSLSCVNCQEKLCHHKKQLQHFLKNGKFNLKGNVILKKKKY